MNVIYAFIAFNTFLFFLPRLVFFKGEGYDSATSFLAMGEKSNVKIRDGEFYRLFTSIFLHVNILHLVFNMYVLWSLFLQTQSLFSLPGFFALYFISGIAGSIASFFANPNPSVGASGAIFGLIGSVLFFALLQGNPDLIMNMLVTVAINFFIGFQLKQVDNAAHLGGFVTGFAAAAFLTFFAPQFLFFFL